MVFLYPKIFLSTLYHCTHYKYILFSSSSGTDILLKCITLEWSISIRNVGSIISALFAKKEQAIFVWNHWSVDHLPISYFNNGFADLVFSWGDYNDGYFNAHKYRYSYMLQTGLIAGESIYDSDKELGAEIRKNLIQI